MLTKQERKAIAARVAFYDGGILTWNRLYECLLDAPITGDVSIEEDSKYVIDCLIDLCDTSNMIELPTDKDGEVIKAGDTVYDKDGDVAEVSGYYHNNGNWKIIIPYGKNDCFINVFPNELTHKKPVTIKSIKEQLKQVLDKGHMSAWSMAELFDIAEQLEKLGDSDD